MTCRHCSRRAFAALLVLAAVLAACAPKARVPASEIAAAVAPVPAPAPSEGLVVGAARMDVSPTDPVMMGGYGVYALTTKFCRWSKGVNDPLFATALYLQKGEENVLLVALDLVGLAAPDIDDLRAAIAARVPIAAGRVVVSASHTHQGPDTIGLWGTTLPPRSGRDEKYMVFMKEQATRAAAAAYASAVPARLLYAVGELKEMHRNIRADKVPGASIDDALTVLKAVDASGKTIVTVTNWACHPTTEGMDNRLISADWIGGFYKWMAAKTDGVPMYVNGSIGAAIQPYDPERELWAAGHHFIWAETMGRRVAEAAAALLPKTTEAEVDAIEVASRPVPFPMMNKIYRFAGRMGLVPFAAPNVGETLASRVTAVRVGPVRFGTVPGEISPHLGSQVREALGGRAQVIVGLAQDYLGYIIDPEQYADKRYGYEKMLCAGPQLGPGVVAAHREIATAMDGHATP